MWWSSSKENPDPVSASCWEMGRDPLICIPDPSQIQPSPPPDSSRRRAKPSSRRVDPDPVVSHFDLAHDHSFWERHNVQVLIRIRPPSDAEKASHGYGACVRQESPNTLAWTSHPETRFTFDHIASQTISQQSLFTVAGSPMVDNCMSGYNSCIFAYGQTGSGKTYTMMGDMSHDTETGKLSDDCGITPRIFQYLFTRITREEDLRRNEGLKYSCKCSFLEIYNEHITDLLDPSSNNLQIREDMKKGVYVENLSEYTVTTVDEVLTLLLQGAANRKMAATHMNSESSRSHSVFTCIVESCWEKDSMTHLRFGRLNLVDLAGSERQKSSGAEGDRLKEAANINKSLSTLGLVIMSLVDLAQGKQRHVPYRDSRLTFLLQDSLGGNSKTTIIANVSPSLCSANETLSTLKFAQRAKLIQNNAKVNEDASGDVMALQREIQQLKGQLSILLHHGDSSENCLLPPTSFKELYLSGFREGVDSSTSMKDEAANIRSDLIDGLTSYTLPEDGTFPCDDGQRTEKAQIFQGHNIQTELIHAKSLIEAMESNQICMIEELESLRKENEDLRKMLKTQAVGANGLGNRPEESGICNQCQLSDDFTSRLVGENQTCEILLQAKLEKLSKDLIEAQLLNGRYLEDHALELHHNQQTQVVQEEVETEATKTILHLQEEIAELHHELQGRLHSLEEENESLRSRLAAKEVELKALCSDWERATFELTAFLLDGSRSLKDASSQIENVTSLFPRDNRWISEHVERAAKLCVDKEESVLLLKSSLEDARSTVLEMEQKLESLRGATIVLTEVQQMKGFENNSVFRDGKIDHEVHHDNESLVVRRDSVVHDENLELERELERKNVLLKGLLFDISLLQESASSKKDDRDEVDKLTDSLDQVQIELKMKTNCLDNMLTQYAALEGRLTETENALTISNSDLEEVTLTLDGLREENADLKVLLKDLYLKKSEANQLLEEQAHAMEDLENEILRMAASTEENTAVSMKEIKNDMAKVTIERDSLLDRIQSLQNKLDIANALTDEKEAIIIEIRQESEASKEYAEIKEEEVQILTHSVEELESTINVLEKKVSEMEDTVERHHGVRSLLEVEVMDMRRRLLMVVNKTEDVDSRSSEGELCKSKSLRKLHEGSTELCKAHNHIRILEKDKEKLVKQVKQYQEYVSELVMHAEAQASQYQQKYKNLESMVHEVRTDSSKVVNGAPSLDKSEKASVKPRGSSSPFRCISNLVQQMNLEKEQELSVAQLRTEELEALVARQQKELSLLKTRLAAVESMTHDVIRDLLGVKLDINNYSDLVSENRLQELVEEAQQQAHQYITMEREIVELRKRIQDLVEERESWALEADRREADELVSCMALEKMRERDQMLAAQNEMLKADKTSLQRKVAELDGMVKQFMQTPERQLTRSKDHRSRSVGRLH